MDLQLNQLKLDYSMVDPKKQLAVQTHAKKLMALMRDKPKAKIAMGKELIELKIILAHGFFDIWLKRNIRMSSETRSVLIRAYEAFQKFALLERIDNIDLDKLAIGYKALSLLLKEETTNEHREEAFKRAYNGEEITVRLAKAIIFNHEELKEIDLQKKLVNLLKQQDITVQEPRLPCLAGVPDIVTFDAVYEIKLYLNKDDLFEAIGQVLLYRQCLIEEKRIKPSAKAFIVGIDDGKIKRLIPHINKLGVEVKLWNSELNNFL